MSVLGLIATTLATVSPVTGGPAHQAAGTALQEQFSLARCLSEIEPEKARELSAAVIISDYPPTIRIDGKSPCVSRARDAGVKLTDVYILAETVTLGELRQRELVLCVKRTLDPNVKAALSRVWKKGEEASAKLAGDDVKFADSWARMFDRVMPR